MISVLKICVFYNANCRAKAPLHICGDLSCVTVGHLELMKRIFFQTIGQHNGHTTWQECLVSERKFEMPIHYRYDFKLMILQVTTAHPWRARKWSDPACQLRTLRLAGSLVTCDTINRDLAPFIRSRVPASRLLELDRYLRHLGLMLPDLQKVHKCLCFLIHANISYYSN